MNRRLLVASLSVLVFLVANGQPYAIGNRNITFYDADRDRDVPAEVYYPAVTGGADTPAAAGAFPVLVFGHGFVMTTAAYANIWSHFVPKGYILVLPTTEGGFAPDHSAFGADLSFLAAAMQAEHTEPGSPFEGHVLPATALMGHSMGGGASFLGAAGNTGIQALVNLAPAETNPSATAAAGDVLVPTLVFGASEDCVTPIADHQGPMYAASAAPCKAFVNILGGGHCYFANSNFNCSFGEFTCAPDLSISREAQQDVVNDLAGLWLDHHLKGEQDALNAFIDSTVFSTRISAQVECLSTAVREVSNTELLVHPSPAADRLTLESALGVRAVRFLDVAGREVLRTGAWTGTHTVDLRQWPVGTYTVHWSDHRGSAHLQRVMVLR
jgi:predicted dienelactone hydrolase